MVEFSNWQKTNENCQFSFCLAEIYNKKMYAISMTTVKSHQFRCRVCMKGCCKVQKFSCNNPPMDKIQRRKDWWKNVFGKYLLLTNTISSGILMAVGDLIQQEIEYIKYGKHKNSFDWNRNMNMGIVGTFQGPLAHFFYQILDKYFPGIKMTTIMKKIFLDQTIASPLCIILFFGGMNYLGNKNFEVSKAELKEKFFLVYAVDCSVWIPAQFLNFYCLSAKYRVIYINLLTMCYNVFLSFIKHAENLK